MVFGISDFETDLSVLRVFGTGSGSK